MVLFPVVKLVGCVFGVLAVFHVTDEHGRKVKDKETIDFIQQVSVSSQCLAFVVTALL